ncbi:hypothetical protein [Bacillus sp. NEB1478]|uniref:hypothetical protein n=1 Tax=Bacillus sp. NEB1478 TaxID=3073816 RepID=UPI0028735C92|nr:hypothetical protein [Bacillus sp. NEB1478]WNB91118.1 hypothetical protein RGB74_14570 [Bacillus sp. NEB1478]
MIKYEALHKKEEVNLLNNLIGQRLTSIFGSSITKKDGLTSYHSYATVFLRNYEQKEILAFTCRLLETPNDEEYWKISVQKQKKPPPITYEADYEGNPVSPTKTEIPIETSVKKVSIFSKELQTRHELLIYDHAVVFALENEKTLCISAILSPCGVDISLDDGEIKKILGGCSRR